MGKAGGCLRCDVGITNSFSLCCPKRAGAPPPPAFLSKESIMDTVVLEISRECAEAILAKYDEVEKSGLPMDEFQVELGDALRDSLLF